MARLEKPDGIGDDEWRAIQDAEARLLHAKEIADLPLVVGAAKELCETLAKVVIAERGGVATTATDYPELITSAHRILEYQPGEGLATDPEPRKIAQGLKTLVIGLGEMRNRHGTGHGRAAPTGVVEEHAELAFDAAFLWSSWALRRLEPYIAGEVTTLVRDLEREIFRRGDLTRRLALADLPRLPEADQRLLGVAVARRASRGTFVIGEEGLDRVAEQPDAWPRAYVEGLLTGLFFHPNGYLDLNAGKVTKAARLLRALPNVTKILQELGSATEAAAKSNPVATDDDERRKTIEAFEEAASALPEGEPRDLWLATARAI